MTFAVESVIIEHTILQNQENKAMPPKPKFTKEHVVHVALELVSKSGIEALTSRGLGKALGCSACPVFTMFKDMGEVRNEVYKEAKKTV